MPADDMLARLESEFSEVDPRLVRLMLDEALGRIGEARIPTFVPLLAYREARRQLRGMPHPTR